MTGSQTVSIVPDGVVAYGIQLPVQALSTRVAMPWERETGTVVEVDHPKRGKYLTVGNPVKMSDSPTEVLRSPLLGEHTDEVMAELGFNSAQIAAARAAGAI